MTLTKNHIVIIALVISVLAILAPYVLKENKALGSAASRATADCLVSTSTASLITSSASRQLLGTSTIRAWARIQQPLNATNTVQLAFNQDVAASPTSGVSLPNATTSQYQTSIEFGLNTDFPYTGAVTGSTSVSGAIVQVIECNYR